jgi:Tol biopolymer transport system component
MQLTNTASDKSLPLWSPDGKMLAYESLSSPGSPQLEVVSLSGGEAKAIPGVRLPGWWENYAWAREGRQITVALEGSIYSVSLTGDKEPPLVDLKQLGVDMYFRFSWSPDGHDLAFLARKEGDSNKLYVFRRESGKTEQLATDFQNKFGAWWSPDGKWLAYECDSYFKKRPEGVLWAMDIEEALTKLSN